MCTVPSMPCPTCRLAVVPTTSGRKRPVQMITSLLHQRLHQIWASHAHCGQLLTTPLVGRSPPKDKKTPTKLMLHGVFQSALGRIRTCNPWFRRPVLYPIELRTQTLDSSTAPHSTRRSTTKKPAESARIFRRFITLEVHVRSGCSLARSGANLQFHACRASRLREIVQQISDERRPARLMAGSDAAAVVAMEVFVEEDELPPVRIIGVSVIGAMTGTTA